MSRGKVWAEGDRRLGILQGTHGGGDLVDDGRNHPSPSGGRIVRAWIATRTGGCRVMP